jgi:hypothetical protein
MNGLIATRCALGQPAHSHPSQFCLPNAGPPDSCRYSLPVAS